MFLFTTPPTPTTRAPEPPSTPVVDAIRAGAERTGTGFEYLLATAKRESALDPTAKASTSSATGLFQFIEQTWLGLVRSEGDKVGLATEAKAVVARGDGGLTVADPDARQAILKLREDPALASHMAGALTRQNQEALAAATGREPSSGELYMAHVLGARGATELIAAAGREPGRVAAIDFPEAARANRAIFYERGGRPRGAGEVYAALAASHSGRAATTVPVAATVTDAPSVSRPSGLNGMFQTGPRSGPISDAVAKIWRVNNEGGRLRTASLSYFPRSEPARTLSDATVEPVRMDASASATTGPSTDAASGGGTPLTISVTRRASASAASVVPSSVTTASAMPRSLAPSLTPSTSPAPGSEPPLPPSRPRAGLSGPAPATLPTAAGQPLSLSSFMIRQRP